MNTSSNSRTSTEGSTVTPDALTPKPRHGQTWQDGPDRPPHESSALEEAIYETFVYADLFDYPLRPQEVVRYLGIRAEPAATLDVLERSARRGHLARANGYFALPGRQALFALRENREAIARRKWPLARRYATWLAHLPFVRMVAITGTLAVNNVETADDIDLLIVTEPGRLWLCRAFVIAVVRLAALAGEELCPNYFLSSRQLAFPDRNYFSAREVAQMVPLYGVDVYERIRGLNGWVAGYLPQASGMPSPGLHADANGDTAITLGALGRRAKETLEWLLSGRAGARLEWWEMERKVHKLNRLAQVKGGSVSFTPDCCKGHFDHHDRTITDTFEARLRADGAGTGPPDAGLDGRTGQVASQPTESRNGTAAGQSSPSRHAGEGDHG